MKLDSMGRRIPPRTKKWSENIGKALRKGIEQTCPCGKDFYIHRYRIGTAKYCSHECRIKYCPKGGNKGKKIPKGSLAKLGERNPAYGKVYTQEEREYRRQKMLAFYDKKGRVSKEHKRRVRTELENARWNSKRANGGSFTRHEWDEVKRSQDYTCLHCKRREPEIKLTKDHIVPISKGGTSYISNIQGLCVSCNTRKRDKI